MDNYVIIITEPKYNDTIKYNTNFHTPKYIRNLTSFYRKQYNKYNIPIPKKKQYNNAKIKSHFTIKY